MARPKAGDPEKIAAAVKLLLEGDPDAAVALAGVSLRTLYRARDDAARNAPAPSAPAPAAAAVLAEPPEVLAEPTRQPQRLIQVRLVAPSPPATPAAASPSPDDDVDDAGEADAEEPEAIPTLERVRRLIARTEKKLLRAPEVRFGAWGGLLEKLYRREQLLLGPPPPPPDAVQEELRRLGGEMLELIEQHLADPITPAEIAT